MNKKNNLIWIDLEFSGLDFKKAFFGIWLSDNPVQSSLKQQLLGIITLWAKNNL